MSIPASMGNLKRSLGEQAPDGNELAEAMIVTIRQPLLVLDKDLRVVKANPAFECTFQVEPDNTVGQFIYDLGNRQWDIPALRSLFSVQL